MRRLLAISWEMPPLSGPRAVQVSRTLLNLVGQGWASTVICFGPKSNRYNQDFPVDLEAQSAGAIEVVRVPSPEERLFFRALWRVCPPLKHLPDEKRVWIAPALAAARRQIATGRFSAVVSFAQPWSDHLVGLRLHRECGLPWVAHFSDPWADSPYLHGAAWQQRIWRRMEGDVVREATRLVFQNRQTAERTLARYPSAWAAKAVVIPQGFEPLPPESLVSAREDGPLRVVYTGRFYPGVRTPETLLDAVSRLAAARDLRGRLLVEFFGAPFEAYADRARALGIEAVVAFHGRVAPPVALAAARRADALLVIDAPSRGPNLFLPSKLVDYLPLGKPILGVTPPDGASADVIRELGYPVVDPADVDGIVRLLADALDRQARGAFAASPVHRDVAHRFDIRETARELAAVLDAVVPAAAGAA